MKENLNIAVYCREATAPREDRAWLYTRINEAELGPSIEQMQVLLKQAKKMGFTVVGTSQDVGSGNSINRPGLQQMLEAVRKEEVGVVMVCSISRLSRDTRVMAAILKEFNQHKVRLLGREDDFTRNLFENKMLQDVLNANKQMERCQSER